MKAAKYHPVLGYQEPRLTAWTPGDRSLGEEASIYAETFQLSLLDWQEFVLDGALQVVDDEPEDLTPDPFKPVRIETKAGSKEPCKWTNSDVVLIVSRQNGKGSILTARCLYGLFVLGERILHTAHEFKTASDAFARIKGYIEARPALAQRTHFKNQYGLEEIKVYKETKLVGEPTAILKFLARSGGSGRGFAADLIILDEAYDLKEEQVRALTPTQITAENSQLWYVSSAVDETLQPNGMLLADMRRRGIAKEEGVAYFEWSAEKGDNREDPHTWAKANPSIHRLGGFNEKTIAKLRRQLGKAGFDVECLSIGEWPEAQSDETVLDMEKWLSPSFLVTEGLTFTGPMCIALDMSANRKWLTIGGARRTTELLDRIRLEVGYHDRPSKAVIGYIQDIVEEWNPTIVMGGNSPAMSLFPELAEVGIEPDLMTPAQIAAATGGFVDDFENYLLTHDGDERVEDALRGVVKKELAGGAFGWDYRSPCVLPPLQAITMARWGLLMLAEEKKKGSAPSFHRGGAGPSNEGSLAMAGGGGYGGNGVDDYFSSSDIDF